MKIGLCVHGYPPELVGGTELSTRALAHALARRGHALSIFSGTLARSESTMEVSTEETCERVEPLGATIRVVRVARGDLHVDHWHKSRSPAVARALRAWLKREALDVVHVQHWLRLSSDLVCTAARERVPAVVSLHDSWTSCPLVFRVRPDTLAACEQTHAPDPCIACAARVGPRTPWVPLEAAFMAFAQRQREIARELELARAIVVPSRAHQAALERFADLARVAERVVVLAPRPAPEASELGGRPLDPIESPSRNGRLVLGAFGHLLPHKGLDLTLDALARLHPRRSVELVVAGDDAAPEFARRLRERARGLPVRFFSAPARSELATHPVSLVHAWVLASRAAESWGLVLDEARALHLPTLLADHGAFALRGREGGALLFGAGDANSLARACERLLDEPGLHERLVGEASQLATTGIDAETWAGQHEELYQRVRSLPLPEVRPEEWFEARMREEFIERWDRGCRSGGPATHAS